MSRLMILMQGIPGSGKSTLAEKLSILTHGVICSADSFLMEDGVYNWSPERAANAYKSCQSKVLFLAKNGLDMIVDNTNTKLSDMKPYLKIASDFGYSVKIVRVNTPWAKDISQCFIKNTHNVPLETLQRMLDNINREPVEATLNYLRTYVLEDVDLVELS